METYTTIVKFFQEGGFFMYPIALLLAVGAAIAAERWLFLTRAERSNRRMWDELMPTLQAGKLPQAVSITMKSDVAIAKVLNYGLSRLKSARRREDIEMITPTSWNSFTARAMAGSSTISTSRSA